MAYEAYEAYRPACRLGVSRDYMRVIFEGLLRTGWVRQAGSRELNLQIGAEPREKYGANHFPVSITLAQSDFEKANN